MFASTFAASDSTFKYELSFCAAAVDSGSSTACARLGTVNMQLSREKAADRRVKKASVVAVVDCIGVRALLMDGIRASGDMATESTSGIEIEYFIKPMMKLFLGIKLNRLLLQA